MADTPSRRRPLLRRPLGWLASAALLALAAAAGWWALDAREGDARYRTARIERGSITAAVSSSGTLNAVTTVQVGSQVSGQVKEIYVDFNSPVEKGMLNMRDLRIIWKSRPIPNGPMTARADLPQSFKDDFTQFHLALATAHPQIYAQIERGGGRGYSRVTHADFEPIVQLRREEAAERRRRV